MLTGCRVVDPKSLAIDLAPFGPEQAPLVLHHHVALSITKPRIVRAQSELFLLVDCQGCGVELLLENVLVNIARGSMGPAC